MTPPSLRHPKDASDLQADLGTYLALWGPAKITEPTCTRWALWSQFTSWEGLLAARNESVRGLESAVTLYQQQWEAWTSFLGKLGEDFGIIVSRILAGTRMSNLPPDLYFHSSLPFKLKLCAQHRRDALGFEGQRRSYERTINRLEEMISTWLAEQVIPAGVQVTTAPPSGEPFSRETEASTAPSEAASAAALTKILEGCDTPTLVRHLAIIPTAGCHRWQYQRSHSRRLQLRWLQSGTLRP